MSNPVIRYWEPIDAGSDFSRVYSASDDKDHMDKNRRRKIIVDPKLPYSLMSPLLIVFVLASGIFFATLSFAFLEFQTTVETLQLPQEHQVFSDLRRIENAAMLAFVAIFLGIVILVIGGGLFSVQENRRNHLCAAPAPRSGGRRRDRQ